MALVYPRGVKFVALQLRGATGEWWKTYMRARPDRFPLVEWDVCFKRFSGPFSFLECLVGEFVKV